MSCAHTAMRPKTSHPLKTNPTLSASHSNPATENSVSPTLSRHRRKRSEARRGTKALKNNPQDSLQRPGRSHSSTHTAPVKDPPPHLVPTNPRTPVTSVNLNKDIDALVERVRAVAMAENRPSTPGSHIDWAGEDDDSLPDLDDWGITTTHSKIPVISPIIINGLKPLPESTPSAAAAGATDIHVAPSPSLQPAENPEKTSQVTPTSISEGITEHDRLSQFCEKGKALIPIDEAQDLTIPADHVLEGLAQSIHAPPVAYAGPGKESSAPIFTSRRIVDSISTPTQLNVLRHGQGRDRSHTVGRSSNRNGRLHGSSKQHNHASPPASTHRSSHSRPMLTGAAISRLARVVGNTATPSPKVTPIAND